jgi:hypothetical protein
MGMGMQASHELLKNRGACGANREQPTANSQQPTANSRKPTAEQPRVKK